MAWWETNRGIQRKKLILEWLSGDFTVTELSLRHDISRDKTYKWIRRYKEFGPDGLEDQSHRPHSCPHATPDYILEEAVCLRASRRVAMGAGKVRTRLLTEHPEWPVPSERTLHNHFTKLDLVPKPRRHRKSAHPGRPTTPFTGPNSIWSADFKGDFKTRDGWRCYPLTIQDGFSRYLLECQGLDGTRFADTKRVFTRVFREFGLPERIRTDNGVPFYVGLPGPTIDWTLGDGVKEIPIEERDAGEVTRIKGRANDGRVVEITITPDGSLLFVANTKGDNLVAFRSDGDSGRLEFSCETEMPSPVCAVLG